MRTFVLGAGFSKQAGMPLATELTSLVVEGTELKEDDDLQSWLADLQRRLCALQGKGEDTGGLALNIEQLFDFAKYDQELWRMKQQLELVGRLCGVTSWSRGEDIEKWLEYMEKGLAHVVWGEQERADAERIKPFASCLSEDDVVVTFNYDTLLERSLSAMSKPWNHGLDDRSKGGVSVLKMHGSVDWILLQRRNDKWAQKKFSKLFSKKDTNVSEHGNSPPQEEEYAWELWRAKDTTTCNAVLEMDRNGLCSFPYRLGIAGLGRYKPLHSLPGSAQTWFTAFEALKAAEEICVIGFSMSPYDAMARFHFTSVMQDRCQPPSKVLVVDPNATHLVSSFHGVFGGPLTLVASGAENVDWGKLLA